MSFTAPQVLCQIFPRLLHPSSSLGRLLKCMCAEACFPPFSHCVSLKVMPRCESDAPCPSLGPIWTMPERLHLDGGKWLCADGPQRAFDPKRESFCIEGLCESASLCSADVEATATKSWSCPTEKQLFSKIAPTNTTVSSAGFCRIREKASADPRSLPLARRSGQSWHCVLVS